MNIQVDCRRLISWKLAFSFFLLLGFGCSQTSVHSIYITKLLLCGGRWAKPEICYQILYKESLPSKKIDGMLVILEGKAKDAFRPETNDNIPPDTKDRAASIATSGSSFKAKVAAGIKAILDVIYKFWDPDKGTYILTRGNRGEITFTLIHHLKRMITQLEPMVQDCIQATRRLVQCFWKNCAFSIILVFSAFIPLCYAAWQILIRSEEQRVETEQRMKTLQEAVNALESRKLKKGEFDLAGETCVVCLEAYKLREVVRILTCKHIFHKRCIDCWLLKRGTCPMCNCSIIQN